MEYGSEFDWNANRPFLTGGEIPADWQLFRSGRDALKAFARIAHRRRVLLPALCCESMFLPFAQNGYEIAFYRLQPDLQADTGDLLEKLRDGDVLFYMRYFGVSAFPDAFLEQLRTRRDVLLLEDRTHDILTPRENGAFQPDAEAASLRKWAALPEGGMLRTALGRAAVRGEDTYGTLRLAAMEEKSRYLAGNDASQSAAYLDKLKQAERLLDIDGEPRGMQPRFAELVRKLDFPAVHAARIRNLRRLQLRLTPLLENGKIRLLVPEPEKSGLYLPILIKERDSVHRQLLSRRIFCPAAIWPEPRPAAGVCPVSHSVTEHMLSVLCDQRYSEADMDYIADNLIEIMS